MSRMGRSLFGNTVGLWLLLSMPAIAQTPAIDSLRQAAEQDYRQGNAIEAIHQYADLIKQSLAAETGLPLAADFNRLAEIYESLGTDDGRYRALSARQEAVKLYQAAGELEAAAQALALMASNVDPFLEAGLWLNYQQQALQSYQQLGNSAQVATLARSLAEHYSLTNDFEAAIPYLEQAIAAYETLNASELPELLRFAATRALQENDTERGFAWFEHLIAYHRQAKDWSAWGEANLQMGEWQERKGDPRQSLSYYEAALDGFRKAGATDDALVASRSIAQYYVAAEELNQALSAYEQAIQLAEQLGNPLDTAWLLSEVGQLYRRLQQGQTSVDYYRQALTLYQNPPSGGWELHGRTPEHVDGLINHILTQLQSVYQTLLEQPEQALTIAQEQVALRERSGDRDQLRLALAALADAQDQLGQRAQAITTYERLVALRNQDLDNLDDYGFLTRKLAALYDAVGDREAAIAHTESSIALYRQVNNRFNLARALATMGDIYHRLGETDQQQATYAEAMAIAQELDNAFLKTILRIRLAELKYEAQDFEGALALLQENLTAARALQDPRSEADALERLSDFYSPWMNPAVEDVEVALQYRAQARRVLEQTDDIDSMADTLVWSGDLAWFENRLDAALNYYQQALAAYERDSFLANRKVNVLVNMGRIKLKQSQPQVALRYLEQAMATDVRQTWDILKYQGDAYQQLKQLDRALDFYEKALQVSNTQILINSSGSNSWYDYLETWSAIAQVQRDQGDYAAALTQIRKVIRELEIYSRRLKNPRSRQDFFASVQTYYDLYIDILMRLHQQEPGNGYDGQALQADERRRTQGLLGLLAEANVDIRKGVEPTLLEREAAVVQELEALETRRIAALAQAADTAGIETERDRLLRQYQSIQNQIRAANPQYAQIQYPQPLELQAIQQLLDADTVLLQYSLGEQQSHLWLVSQQELKSYVLPPRAELASLTQTFNRRLRSATSPERLYDAAQALSQPLLAPVQEQLTGKRLLVVSDGALQYVPFAALTQPDSDGYAPLINQYEIVSLPSISTLATLRKTDAQRSQPAKTIAIMADPVFTATDERVVKGGLQDTVLATLQVSRAASDVGISWTRLPGTRQEAQAILELVPAAQSEAHFGFAASKAAAFNPDLGTAQFVHFATHGFVNTQKPELSGIVMSLIDETGQPQNGFLRLNDVYNLDLAAELVVLSACETGTGPLVRGEGLIGLTRGFMYAGAERVVASLWQVDDAATAALMSEFYRQLLTEQATPAAALRAAQQAIAAQDQWAAPYYWAAFTLQGDW
ncbi:MAG: CHAT domain-containing protein [Spirulina sp. SIO3F2]|nr:CHAT domain-containing protein [Spirulina sp. SIO3F2]